MADSGSARDIQAQAHAQIHHKEGPTNEYEFQLSAICVSQELDKKEMEDGPDQIVVVSSEEARAATLKNDWIVSDKTW